MSEQQIDILKRALAREKASRKEAERILEQKSSELYELSQKLQESNEQLAQLVDDRTSELRGVFENIIDAYVVMDLEGNVLRMNDAAVNMLAINLDSDNINLLQFAHSDDYQRIGSAFEKLLQQGSIIDFQINIKTRNGENKLVQINASTIENNLGKTIAAQGIVRDITKIKNLELQQEKLLSRLEKRNEQLQEYAHVVSHDLKSPLRSIDALIQFIKEDNKGKLDQASLNNFNLIESTLERMESLISDVLAYSTADTVEQQKQKIDIQQLLDILLNTIHVPDHINIEFSSPLPVILSYRTKLLQLFQNLIGNAIKAIDKPYGLIKVSYTDIDEFHHFAICDNGVGIEKRFHEKIFKVFHSLQDAVDSSGIGLSIVKKIVDLHQGEIWLESEPGIGTTFYFTLKK